jgi:hypothetical protein
VSRRTTAILAGLTVLAGITVLTGPAALTAAGGLALAFVLPGLALTTALFRDRVALTAVERGLLVPALSLATLVLGGLAAWGAGVPLHRGAWLGIGAVVTLIALGTTLVWPVAVPERTPKTRVKLPTPGDATLILPVFLDRAGERDRWSWRRLLLPVVLPLALVAVLLGGASWLSVSTSVRTHDVAVTALSAAPPSAANTVGERTVAVTATGLSGAAGWTLIVTTPAGTESSRQSLTANAAGEWTGSVVVPGGERTTIGLYRSGDTTAYRTVIVAAA